VCSLLGLFGLEIGEQNQKSNRARAHLLGLIAASLLLGLNGECFDLFEQIIQLAGFDISASYSLVDLRCNCLSERLSASLLQCVPLLSGQTTHVKLSASNAPSYTVTRVGRAHAKREQISTTFTQADAPCFSPLVLAFYDPRLLAIAARWRNRLKVFSDLSGRLFYRQFKPFTFDSVLS
jgi:hypothetical protein